MLDQQTIFDIHRLNNQKLSNRKIGDELGISKDTVSKYLKDPVINFKKETKRVSILEPYYDKIEEMLDQYPDVSAVVILRNLKELGFEGEVTVIRRHLRKVRGKVKMRKVYIRFESEPGEQMQIDWGYFGIIQYNQTKRKLFGFALTEAYSRKLYIEFTHSLKQDVLHQCLFNAFVYLGGTPKELVFDNMTTAVIERRGRVIRFNDAFLKFLLPFKITPKACNIRAPYEKGKVERAIGYIKQNFMPLKTFIDLDDAQNQAINWLNNEANVRIHQTTGEEPEKRATKISLTPLPFPADKSYLQVESLKVYKDFCVRFDSVSYSAPPWTVGKSLILKASQREIKLYYKTRLVATHKRCWEKNKRIELKNHREQATRYQAKTLETSEIALFNSLGEEFREYLKGLVKSNHPIKKNIIRLLDLKNQYGKGSLSVAILKAIKQAAYGADYIENILYQEMTPENNHLPVKVKNQDLNEIRLSEPNLSEYDALIFKKEKRC